MKIRHRLVFDKKSINPGFLNFLESKNAVFSDAGKDMVVVYIFEKEEWKDDLYDFMRKEKTTSIVESVYSKQEYEQATWLSIRSKFRWEYPQPEDASDYINITYDSRNYCSSCGCGLKQKEEFRVNKTPKWGKRNFLMLNWVYDELFISSMAKDIIQNTALKGYQVFDVINHRKRIPIDNMYQLYVEGILPSGLTNKEQSVKEYRNCRTCGSEKYIGSGRGLTFRKEIFEGINTDLIRTSETFGEGLICSRKILVSKAFYTTIKNNKIDRDLVFEPIQLI